MVDLQTVIEELNTGKIEFDYKDDDCCTTEGEVVILLKRLAELENADVEEVKHGEWERIIRNGKPRGLKCSLCGKHIHFHENYCPNCGAKMGGERK